MILAVRKAINDTHINHYLFTTLLILNFIDFETTYIGIVTFSSTELNPVMSAIIAWMGTVWAIFWIKALVFGHMYYHYYHTSKGPTKWLLQRTTWILATLNIIFLSVVINNIIVIMGKM